MASSGGANSTSETEVFFRLGCESLGHLFGFAEAEAEPVLATLSPSEGPALLAEAVLSISDESRLLASIELESRGAWLDRTVRSLVDQLIPADADAQAADTILAALDGTSFYGLVSPDAWPTARQQAAISPILTTVITDGDRP